MARNASSLARIFITWLVAVGGVMVVQPRAAAAQIWLLTEVSLIEALRHNPPEQQALEAAVARAEAGEARERQRYQAELFAEAVYQDSSEKALVNFIPTFGPSYLLSVGVSQSLPYGVALEGRLFGDQQSTADRVIDAATRTGVAFHASVDLWRNLLGRVDRARLDRSLLERQKEELLREINLRVFELEMRKIYWSLVANNEQLRVSRELLTTASLQLKEGVRRGRQYIADKGEIARYRAQVADRQATLLAFEYRRERLVQQLKEYLPHVADAAIKLGDYDRERTTAEVLACVTAIKQHADARWEHTKWDEVMGLIDRSYQQRQIELERYSAVDLQLNSQLQVSGVDRGYEDAFSDFFDAGEPGYSIGVRLEVPLGRGQARTRRALQAADTREFLAEKERVRGRMVAHHTQIVALVSLLQQSVLRLNENNANLKIAIAEIQKKFKQARVSVNELVQNQDALLSGLITEIDAHLQIMHALFDYFKVFTDEPCAVNRINATS